MNMSPDFKRGFLIALGAIVALVIVSLITKHL